MTQTTADRLNDMLAKIALFAAKGGVMGPSQAALGAESVDQEVAALAYERWAELNDLIRNAGPEPLPEAYAAALQMHAQYLMWVPGASLVRARRS